jgi:hypothetical protein
MIQNIDKKYFWDGTQNLSDEFIIRRMLEYAILPDIIKLPFDDVKNYLLQANIDRFWCNEKRKRMYKVLLPYLVKSNTWQEAIDKMIDEKFYKGANK